MYKLLLTLSLCTHVWAGSLEEEAAFQGSTPHLTVRLLAEVQTRTVESGRSYSTLIGADKVVPGDLVYYTLEVRNEGPGSLDSPVVVQPVPVHTVYVANSAMGPGCEVTFSIDGGRTFDLPANLRIAAGGSQRAALASDYTHLRFHFGSLVKAGSTAFLRFRARVK